MSAAELPERTVPAAELASERAKIDRARQASSFAGQQCYGADADPSLAREGLDHRTWASPQQVRQRVRAARAALGRFDDAVDNWLDNDAAEPRWESHAWELREQLRQLARDITGSYR